LARGVAHWGRRFAHDLHGGRRHVGCGLWSFATPHTRPFAIHAKRAATGAAPVRADGTTEYATGLWTGRKHEECQVPTIGLILTVVAAGYFLPASCSLLLDNRNAIRARVFRRTLCVNVTLDGAFPLATAPISRHQGWLRNTVSSEA